MIAALELLATLIAAKLWIPDSEDRQVSRVALTIYTDNQSNEAELRISVHQPLSSNFSVCFMSDAAGSLYSKGHMMHLGSSRPEALPRVVLLVLASPRPSRTSGVAMS